MLRRLVLLFVASGLLVLSSCPRDRGEDEPPDAVDVLWVIDNSNSMAAPQAALAENAAAFLSALDPELPFNIGVVTTDPGGTTAGNGSGGNLRSLGPVASVGECQTPEILRPGDPDLAGTFVDLVDVGVEGSSQETAILGAAAALCKGQPAEFWSELASRPDDDPVRVICDRVPAADRATGDSLPCNADAGGRFFRPGVKTAIIIVSDEGDALGNGSFGGLPPEAWLQGCLEDSAGAGTECGCRTQWLLDFFEGMDQRVVFASLTPSYQLAGESTPWCDGGTIVIPGPCNDFGSTVCSLDMYQQAACASGGLYRPLTENTGGVTGDDPPSCELVNMEAALGDIAALLNGL